MRRTTVLRIKKIIDVLINNPFCTHRKISVLTGIPRSTVTRYIRRMEKLGVLKRTIITVQNACKYEVDQEFVEQINTMVEGIKEDHEKKRGGFPASGDPQTSENSDLNSSNDIKPVRISTKPDNQDEINRWCENGFFRIHGFQRKYRIKNINITDNEDGWILFACLLNDCSVSELPPEPIKFVRIGRKRKTLTVMVKARVKIRSATAYLTLHFKPNCLIVQPAQSIYVDWNDFDEGIERELEVEIKNLVDRAVQIYAHVFKQQPLCYDEGWIGKKRQLKPEVAYVDPDGIIRKVYEVNGALHIEGLGFYIDHSLSETPEAEFETVSDASMFKKAIETIANGELESKIESISEEVRSIRKSLFDDVKGMILEAVKTAIETTADQVVSMVYAGGMPLQQQLTEMWKRIADIQESINLLMMYNMARESGDVELAEMVKRKLLRKLGLDR